MSKIKIIISVTTVRIWIFLYLLFMLNIGGIAGATQENMVVFALENGKHCRIDICNEKIFRIRFSDSSVFDQSLMERYSILNNDWDSQIYEIKTEVDFYVIQNSLFKFKVDKNNGNISILDSTGKAVIKEIIQYHKNNLELTENLSNSLDTYFDSFQTKQIIGDVDDKRHPNDSLLNNIEKTSSFIEFTISNEEKFYGGGSSSRTNIQHRGEALRMWATYQRSEIPVPFIMSSNGWGIFNNNTALNFFDIGRYNPDKLFIKNTNGEIDFYLLLGESMEETINLYTTVTGRPYLLPKWAYGLAFGGHTMENQLDVMNDAIKFREENIPCDVFWIEPQWMAKYYDYSTTKNWDFDKFPGEPWWEADYTKPKYEHNGLFISKLHKLGFKLALWLCIDEDLSVFEEDKIAEKTGNPKSGKENWFNHLTKFIDQGVDGFKLDPARTIDEHPERTYYNGYSDSEMHNLNQILLSKNMYETFRGHKGIRSFHHYCGGYSGAQSWGAFTCGDNGGDKKALFDQLNLGLSGMLNTSADVLEDVQDIKQGIHFGFFLPWVQVNSWYALYHPWYLSPEDKDIFRYYSQLRNSLFPYIYSTALYGSQTGMPILRAMPLVFPDDDNLSNISSQFMFGENFLVGAYNDSVYLPKGNWIDFWTGKKIMGGETIRNQLPNNRGGYLFVKNGAIVPFKKISPYIDNEPIDTLILKIYPEQHSSFTLYEDDGITFNYETGKIAKTQFKCHENDTHIVFTIEPTEGSYDGIPQYRSYQLEISMPRKPSRVLINNKRDKSWVYENEVLVYKLNQCQMNEQNVVIIKK